MDGFEPKRKVEDFLYEKESRLLIQACKEIYAEFGGSFKEGVVEKALLINLEKKSLNVQRQKRQDLFYENEKVGTYVIDMIIEEKIMIELKVKPFLMLEDSKQFWRYLKSSEYKLGYLINFGPKKLEVKRRIYDKARK